MNRQTVDYEIGITKWRLWMRVRIAFRIIFKKPTRLDCSSAGIYHTNRNTPVIGIEL